MEGSLMINNKLNVFCSFFKILRLKIKYLSHVHFGKRNKILGACIFVSNKKGCLKIGDSFKSMKNSVIQSDGGVVEIGNNVFVNQNSVIVSRKMIRIGDNVCIGPNVCIYDHNHNDERVELCNDIQIGEGSWIGAGVIVLQGVSIGKNAIIGAGTIITKDVPDNSVVYQKRENVIKIRCY